MQIIYTKNNCVGIRKNIHTIADAKKILLKIRPERWAVFLDYYKGRRFHNATDINFVVAHDDTYFKNIGYVPPTQFTLQKEL